MVTSARPNFFLLLDLDPQAAWDQTAFEQRLRKKRVEWSRQSGGVARKALVARQNLALISRMREVMADPLLREQEAKKALTELAAVHQTARGQFEKQLALLNAKEVIEPEEIERFIAAFQHLYSAEEIRARLRRREVSLDRVVGKATQTFDATIARTIADRLDFLRLHTLYELLQLPDKTATAALYRATEQLYTRLVALQPTAEVTAQMELAGLACEVFKTEERRISYDEYLRQESLSRLFKDLEESVGRSTRRELHQGQVQIFLEQARKEGWTEQEALEKLKEQARQHQWIVMVPALALRESAQEGTLLCPSCQQINQASQRYCTSCQQALYIECPGCGKWASCEHMACGHCAFPVGNRYLIDKLLEEVREQLQQGEVERAREAVELMEGAWPSATEDARTRWIVFYRETVRNLLEEQKRVWMKAGESLERLTIYEEMAKDRHVVRVRWQPPGEGAMLILRSTQSLDREGQVLPVARLEQFGQRLEQDGSSSIDGWRTGEIVYYTPALVLHQRAYIGPSRRYACVENVRSLTYQYLGSVLRLRWEWPQGSEEALLSAYKDSRFGEHVRPATGIVVKREEYELRGYYDLALAVRHDLYVVVSTLMKLRDEQWQADGVGVQARLASKVVITYEIKRATERKRILYLMAQPEIQLPPLLLIQKQGGLPLNKADGKIFQRIEAAFGESKRMVFDLSTMALPPNTFGKLFFQDDIHYGEFTIHHPGEQQMRLS